MTRIGLFYNSALGVERDVLAAAKWWRKAALLGDADGQAMLGAAHHLGAGVVRDPVAALAWLMRARAARSPFADRFYAGVRESCTTEQLREAERRAGQPLALEEAAPLSSAPPATSITARPRWCGAHRRRHRPADRGEGTRHLDRTGLRPVPARRESSASSTCPATSGSCTPWSPGRRASTSCCWSSPPTTASCRRPASTSTSCTCWGSARRRRPHQVRPGGRGPTRGSGQRHPGRSGGHWPGRRAHRAGVGRDRRGPA